MLITILGIVNRITDYKILNSGTNARIYMIRFIRILF